MLAAIDPVLVGLGGALVGGVASMLGTIVVGRRELTRKARIRLFDELIPDLFEWTSVDGEHGHEWVPKWTVGEGLPAMLRAAIIAGRKDDKRALKLYAVIQRCREAQSPKLDAEARSDGFLTDTSLAVKTSEEVVEAIRDYGLWLGKKIR